MSSLEIPDAALDAAVLAATDYVYTSGEAASLAEAVLRHAGPVLVAAELRRIADAVDTTSDPAADAWLKAEAAGRREVVGLLRGRAAVLDPADGAS